MNKVDYGKVRLLSEYSLAKILFYIFNAVILICLNIYKTCFL